eukprot:CAMPEP_0196585588 /NCGR_PEP_ID=MMETSP1081-20130531/51248_1 /TAXON_ID=36882 /ORGANISM="Pyramimonas amylifera, Strain CCMP720" /LENGTH=126 /DNA_ID=CAMNT_0041907187 /DNA_START=275 /DNA_END=655 /DNA_ORIENTATION=-
MYVNVPPGIKAQQIFCDVHTRSLKFGIKGNPPFLEKAFHRPVIEGDSFWTLEDGVLHLTLAKMEKGQMWRGVLEGHDTDPVSADKDQKRLMLERFQEENPGFDFSGAEFNGACPDPRMFMGGISYK